MKKNNFKNILALSLTTVFANTVVIADEQVKTQVIQRNFVNLGFESPPLDFSKRKNGEWGCRLSNGAWTKSYCIFDQTAISGWRTTAKYEGTLREIELWKEGQLSSNDQNWGPQAGEGSVYAELNSTTAAALYQNVCVSNQDVLDWSFQHRPRENIAEQAGFFIANAVNDRSSTDRIALNFDNIPASIRYLKKTDILTQSPNIINGNVLNTPWKTYSGSGVELKNYLGGKKSAVMAFGFEALQTQGSAARGNWLDNVVLKLNPGVEFSAESGSVIENQTGKYHSVDFNVVGNLQNNIEVKFIIDLRKVPNPARYRDNNTGDYKLYALNKDGSVKHEIIPTVDANNSNILRFSYHLVYDSSLKYDQGVTVKGLAIKLFDNDVVDGNRVVPFELDPVQTGLSVMDLRSCGENVFSGFQYEIVDDEVNLSISKSLNEEIPAPNSDVSYDIILESLLINGKAVATAENVTLKEQLLSNLFSNAETELKCEVIPVDGVNASCPQFVSATDAATRLFSVQGLNIGKLLPKAKFKFTVSKLKVAATESGPQIYKGLIANQIEVITSSNDIYLENNIAIAKNLYLYESDLSNRKNAAPQTETGTGLFFIYKEGRTGSTALLTKTTDQQGRVYFPLNIENKGLVTQNYKLYASSTAITTATAQAYSKLNQDSISTFLMGVQVRFYAVDESFCKAGLNSGEINEIQVTEKTIKQVCAEISISNPELKDIPLWFAIASVETGLSDIIHNAITTVPVVQRMMELVNDQRAQVAVGGTYVFLHRLFNKSTHDEKDVTFEITSFNSQDDFAYTLFVDKNNDGQLDAQDQIITSLDQKFSVAKNQLLQLLLKVQAPSTATNGMMSQVSLTAIPNNTNQSIVLESLVNTDTVYVGSDQIAVTKMQFKQSNCATLSMAQIQAANYSLVSQTIGAKDCLIYRISVKNIGSEKLSNVRVNDMYPAYTVPWKDNLPLVAVLDSRDVLSDDGKKIEAILYELLPQQEKSLYFGIKMQF